MKCGLEIETQTDDFPPDCDGCGEEIKQGAQYIGNIDSCCGGCTRNLCKECVEAAAKLLNPETPDAWGRTGQLL